METSGSSRRNKVPPRATQEHEWDKPAQQPCRPPTGLRILCLHDSHSSASCLKDDLSMLGDRLYEKHGIDLVYINSPLCNSVDGETDRLWWETRSSLPAKTPLQQEQEQLIGLDASLLLLQQIWSSMPFWGILGVGQGASVASLLSLLPDVKPKPKFGIFIHGDALIQEAERLVDGENWTCLHLVDDDFLSGMDKLIQQFGGEVHKSQRSDDGENFSKKDLNVIGKFIVDQKKKTRQIGESRALELRNQLYTAEQQASRLIAERIAEDPPSVLMAVVAPKAVAACVGGIKRRGPNEEGGGAPCPPEFLLRRETRFRGDVEGAPSRVHPDDEQEQRSND